MLSLLRRLAHWLGFRRRSAADGSMLVLVNAHHETIPFVIPELEERLVWSPVLDTWFEDGRKPRTLFEAGDTYQLSGRSVAVLRTAPGKRSLTGLFANA